MLRKLSVMSSPQHSAAEPGPGLQDQLRRWHGPVSRPIGEASIRLIVRWKSSVLVAIPSRADKVVRIDSRGWYWTATASPARLDC